ncbi:MAG: PTS sugar transporter subunit IIA [Rhodobacteraceae bacterium]|nr:PTS sugar transporter subunit IIA [Paracoccaceae bacterium]
MLLGDILSADGVKTIGATTSKKRLLHNLGELAAAAYGLDAATIAAALMVREGLGPTGLGNGIALPHAHIEGIDTVLGMFIRLEKPMAFDSAHTQPVDLVFALLAPENAGAEHLRALALVARTMRDPATCAKLRANAEPVILHAVLTEISANQAA